jgi:hypothetical protein
MGTFLKPLEDKFEFVKTPESPGFIFSTDIDHYALNYPGVRIWVTGENLIPDFNVVDYAIGFNDIHFGDRYLRWPLYRWHRTISECEDIRKRAIEKVPATHRARFCACVISNVSNRQGPLAEICDALELYQGMTYGGRWRNNIGRRVSDKVKLLQEHKFSIAFENTSYPGYTTEKIVDAFLAGTIPVYWGDPTVTQHFNPRAFVQCTNELSIPDVVKRIKEINESKEYYESMLREPIFTPMAGEDLRTEHLVEFVKNIFDQPIEKVYRRNRSRWGIKYEELLTRMYFNPLSHLVRLPKIWAVHSRNKKND